MSDPIERLSRLGDALEGAPMPLTASEIRARGDRIRRRNHALIAAASAATVAAVVVPIVALTTNGSHDGDRIAPKPTASDQVRPGGLGEANLLTNADTVYHEGADWRLFETLEGDDQAEFSPCARESLADLGAESVWQRNFRFVATEGEQVDPTLHFNEAIAEFSSPADAAAAYAEISGWYADCLPAGADHYDAGTFTEVPILVDGRAESQVSTYGPVDESLDPFGEERWFLETGLVLSADRIAVLTHQIHGQDYNWPERTPVEQMLPAAAERLVRGGGGAPHETAPVGEWPTSLPESFPLTSGWPEDDDSSEFQLVPPSSDNRAMLAAGELQGCQALDDGDPVDRLTARIDWGSSAYVREIQLFAGPDHARAYLDSIQDSYSICAAQGPTDDVPSYTYQVGQGAVGDESWVITAASDGIGRMVINVVRVGNVALVDLTSDEGTGDTVQDLATETRENLADVVGAMCGLSADGC